MGAGEPGKNEAHGWKTRVHAAQGATDKARTKHILENGDNENGDNNGQT